MIPKTTLGSCDSDLKFSREENSLLRERIELLDGLTKKLTQQRDSAMKGEVECLEKSQTAFPNWFWVLVGIFSGTVVYGIIK